jgi:hypothetical protein
MGKAQSKRSLPRIGWPRASEWRAAAATHRMGTGGVAPPIQRRQARPKTKPRAVATRTGTGCGPWQTRPGTGLRSDALEEHRRATPLQPRLAAARRRRLCVRVLEQRAHERGRRLRAERDERRPAEPNRAPKPLRKITRAEGLQHPLHRNASELYRARTDRHIVAVPSLAWRASHARSGGLARLC